MLRRYAVASLLIVMVSLATASLAYAAGNKLTYSASCTAEVFVRAPATAQPAANPDFLTFTDSLAANQVALATPTVYQQLAQAEHISASVLGSKIQISPAPGIGAFRVTVTDTDFRRTKRIADSACATYVSLITKQRVDEINGDVNGVQTRLAAIQADLIRLQAIPAQKRTSNDLVALAIQENALKFNALLIAALKSMPPDNILVLTPPTGVASTRSISLKKYVVIALVAALLVIFLFILVAEAVSPENRARASAGEGN